ncbi:MAG: hypothetical protein AABN95_26465 [Acidobacteriota bacterium]
MDENSAALHHEVSTTTRQRVGRAIVFKLEMQRRNGFLPSAWRAGRK